MQMKEQSLDDIFTKIGFGKFHVIVIVIFGFFQCFDAIELILLAFLAHVLNCAWRISALESSIITMSVFVGMIFGSLSLGKFSDKYGRKKTISLSVCGIFYFSILCAASPTVVWVVICRLLIGVCIGGVMIMTSTFLTEMMPIDYRGVAQMSVQLFWPLGSFYISLLTVILVPKFGWRVWILLSGSPMILILPTLLWIPESPRYLLLVGRKSEALQIVNQIASINKVETVTNVKTVEYKKPSLYDIFHHNYLRTTAVTTYICFVSGMSYYAFILSASVINEIPRKCLQGFNIITYSSIYINSSIDNSCCFNLSWNNMETVFISITGEFLSYSISICIIKFLKRKPYLQILMLINTVVLVVLNFCLSPIFVGIILMFGRGCALTMLGIIYLYLSEVFPTTVRSFSIGVGSSFARIGAMVSSVIVNMVMIKTSYNGALFLYCALNIVGFFSVFLLPYETKDRALLQTVDEAISESEVLQTTK